MRQLEHGYVRLVRDAYQGVTTDAGGAETARLRSEFAWLAGQVAAMREQLHSKQRVETVPVVDAARGDPHDPTLRAAAGNMECRSRTCRVDIADDKTGKVTQDLALFAQRA